MKPLIAPSLLSANFANLQQDIEMINRSQADWLHLDIMDGVFVPNISFGFPVIEAIAPLARKPLDVHLMITQPEKFISRLQALGTFMMNVHYEACLHLHRTVQEIKKAGMKAGVTLNPHTPVSMLEDILPDVDMVLLMSVNPGFGGQKFIPQSTEKIARLKEMILRKNLSTLIEVDGGINLETARLTLDAGADILVCGNSIFSAENPEETIAKLKAL
ncbi:MAG TPA: ribulose-phosphate 3-epimerase [Candidatus Caccoplasma merdavium]|nr:ribulose-phosphate 3-epimerase [Candidatus Caccoplasma merdavium]